MTSKISCCLYINRSTYYLGKRAKLPLSKLLEEAIITQTTGGADETGIDRAAS